MRVGRTPGPDGAGADWGAAPSLPAIAVEEEADEAPQAQAPEDEAALQVILFQGAQGGGARCSLVSRGVGTGHEAMLPPPCVRGRSWPIPRSPFLAREGLSCPGGHNIPNKNVFAACCFFHRKLVILVVTSSAPPGLTLRARETGTGESGARPEQQDSSFSFFALFRNKICVYDV